MTAVAREHIIHHASNDCGSSLPTKKKKRKEKNHLIKDKNMRPIVCVAMEQNAEGKRDDNI